ncbi:methionine synthase [Picrophilus oshimae]|uniref:Methionine synthase (B12-independent) n=1 Tax=Picrophilus torridus (strain ATCC 700027 / DSM 9790 / JCM 10055 / NBRC 100828 / KAW 2/3) TaxID=1122961 RepID=Q6L2N1_PICTO|nr:methionine synthase [Picrophilus oshimae]AAT42771.1 methionine synthase II, cobalamin-independent [Picrophilus oshimae DSM 9789]SMD31706.1 methionine synthase (B12-independent) [Picrophilus oshimae DSM 9789]
MLITQEIGSFRKPEYLSRVFHKIYGTDEFYRLAEKATLETLDVFYNAGLENIGVGGEMFRWEMYEHQAINIDGIEFYGPVRSFDNRYYRKGSIVKRMERKSSYHLKELEFLMDNARGSIKVPVTGAYTMMDWSFNEFYRDRYDVAMEFARLLNDEIKDLKSAWDRKFPGKKLEIQIDEPATTTHPDEMDIVKDSINKTVYGIDNCEFSIHVCYSSDYRLLYDIMDEINIDGYNLEFANRDTLEPGTSDENRPGYLDLKYFAEHSSGKKFMGLGVTDVHIDYVEPVKLIEDRIRFALKYIDPEKLRLNPDCGLRTRSREIGFQKLSNMVAAKKNILKEL